MPVVLEEGGQAVGLFLDGRIENGLGGAVAGQLEGEDIEGALQVGNQSVPDLAAGAQAVDQDHLVFAAAFQDLGGSALIVGHLGPAVPPPRIKRVSPGARITFFHELPLGTVSGRRYSLPSRAWMHAVRHSMRPRP